MSPQMVIDIAKQAIEIALLISAPILGAGLVVGLIVSIFQAATQIQEMTLTFIPKIIAVFIALVIFMPWMMNIIINFTMTLFINLPILSR